MRSLRSTVALLVLAGLCVTACNKDDDDTPAPSPGSGSLVSSFGTGGVVLSNPSSGMDQPDGLCVAGTSVFLIGSDESPGSGDRQWRIEKRDLTSGGLLTAFGSGGVLTTNPVTNGNDHAVAALQDGTWLYIVGYDESAGPGDIRWRVEKRALTTGALDTGFGTGGVYTSDPSVRWEEPRAVIDDGTNLYVIGLDESPGSGDSQWRVEKLTMSTGALVTGFGSGGVWTTDPTTGGDDQSMSAVHDGTNLYVVGYDSTLGAGNQQWRVQAITLATGVAVTGFGSGGTLQINPSSGTDAVVSVTHDGTNLLLAGLDASPGGGDVQIRVEMRTLATGSLVSAFGTGGVVTVNPTAGQDAGGCLTDGTWLYFGGTIDDGATDSAWYLEVRSLLTGALDTGFNGTGTLTVNPSVGNDALVDGAVVGSAVLLLGTDRSIVGSDAQWRLEKRRR